VTTRIAAAIFAVGLALAGTGEASPRRAALAYVAGGRGGVPKVWLAQADGTHARVLGTGESALLSPNGQLVAATPFGFAGPGVTLFSATGVVKGRFFDASKESDEPVAWSRDSRYLAVVVIGANKPGRAGLVVIDTRSNRTTRLAHGAIAGVSFAPDRSDRLVYGQDASINYKKPLNVFLASPNGKSVHQLTHDASSSDPAWGTRGIAFNHAGGPHPSTAINQVWLMRPDGTHRTQITSFTSRSLAFGLTPLQFSADGTRLLAAYQGSSGTSQTWTIDIRTHSVHKLTVHGREITPAGLSHNGKAVLVEAEKPQTTNNTIETIPFSGGSPTVVAHGDAPTWNR
jgi:Tol biopolymer transport system component